MKDKTRDLWNRYKKKGSRFLAGALVLGCMAALVINVYQVQSKYQPQSVESMQLQKNHVVFPGDKKKESRDKKNGSSDLWEKDKSMENKLKKSQIPDSGALFEREKAKENPKSKNYIASDESKQTAVSSKGVKPGQNEDGIRVKVSGKSGGASGIVTSTTGGTNGNGAGDGSQTGTQGQSGSGQGDSGSTTDHTNKNQNSSGGENNNKVQNTAAPKNTTSPAGTEKPQTTPEPEIKAPEKNPSLPKGDRLIESTYQITEYPQAGVGESQEKLHLSIIPILDVDYENYIYYNASLTKDKLLTAVLVYVLDENNNYKYRITSFNDNFTVSSFPATAKEDFEVTFSFRQNASAAWQQTKYTFEVAPYKYFVLGREGELLASVAPDMSADPKGNQYNLLGYYEKLLSEESRQMLSREKGFILSQIIPGWRDEYGREIAGDLYTAKEKGWKAFYPLEAVSVPAYEVVEMKWYQNLDDFDNPANLKYLQTLTYTKKDTKNLQVMKGIQWVDLADKTYETIQLPDTTAVLSDSVKITKEIKVDEKNPFLSSKDGVLYDKEQTELLMAPSEKEEIHVPSTVTKVTISKQNQIRKIGFDSIVPPEIDLSRLSDTSIWVSDEAYDNYLAAWKDQLPETVKIYHQSTEEHIIRDGAVLSQDGRIMYRISGTVKGNYVVPEGVEIISRGTFDDCKDLKELILPASVKSIERGSMRCDGLEKLVVLGKTLPAIVEGAVQSEETVQIYVPKGASQRNAAGWDDFELKETDLKLFQDGEFLFLQSDDDVELLKVPVSLEEFTEKSTSVTFNRVAPGAFAKAGNLLYVDLGETVNYIGAYAFNKCQTLEMVLSHQKNKIEVADQAFADASNLRNITFEAAQAVFENNYRPYVIGFCAGGGKGYPATVDVDYAKQIYELGGAKDFFVEKQGDDQLVLYADCETDRGKELYLVSVSSTTKGRLSFRKDITTIVEYAFMNCSGIMQIDFSEYKDLYRICNYAFYESGISGVVTIPDNIEILGKSTFMNCSNIRKVVLGTGLTAIASSTFSGCMRLEEVNFAEGSKVSKIENNAFATTVSLTEITFPASLTEFEPNLFSYSSVKKITFTSKNPPEPVLGKEVEFNFGTSVSGLTVYVPAGCRQAYETAWKQANGGVMPSLKMEETKEW